MHPRVVMVHLTSTYEPREELGTGTRVVRVDGSRGISGSGVPRVVGQSTPGSRTFRCGGSRSGCKHQDGVWGGSSHLVTACHVDQPLWHEAAHLQRWHSAGAGGNRRVATTASLWLPGTQPCSSGGTVRPADESAGEGDQRIEGFLPNLVKVKVREEAEGDKGGGGNILVEGVRYLNFFLKLPSRESGSWHQA